MSLSLDAIVSHLVSLGFSKEVAEAEAREQLGLAPRSLLTADRDELVLEKEEQAEISKLFRAYGFDVKNLSQARPTKQAPGVPDLIATHRELPIWFWWESKRQVGGEYSPAQIAFRDDCRRCGVGWGGGDRYDAAEYLVARGLAHSVGGREIEPNWRTA